jgi:hypothetical protein
MTTYTFVQAETAVASSAVVVRLTRVGNSSLGWDLVPEADDGYHLLLSPGEQLVAVVEQAMGRPQFLGNPRLRIDNPYGRRLSVKIVWRPRDVPGDALTVLDTVTAGSGFIDHELWAPDHELTVENLETDRVAPVSVLLTGWSARVSLYPGTTDTEQRV